LQRLNLDIGIGFNVFKKDDSPREGPVESPALASSLAAWRGIHGVHVFPDPAQAVFTK
jgi:hypothetical protein